MAKILILDDDFLLARGWKRTLEAHGHSVTIALSSPEAIAHVEYDLPDLFLVDYMLKVDGPASDDTGHKLIAYLAKTYREQFVKRRVILVSSMNDAHLRADFRRAMQVFGNKAFLSKPFSQTTLVHTVEGMLGKIP